MKIQRLILPVLVLLITLSLTACTTDNITDEEDISIEEMATGGENGNINPDDDE